MTNEAEKRLAIARGLQLAGRVDAAIDAYDEVLALVPDYEVARREIGALSIARGDDKRAIAELDAYLALCPVDARAHHLFAGAVARQDGPSAVLTHYGLVEHDPQPLDDSVVVAMLVVRDEVDRLDAILDHHRRLGAHEFVVVDNGSTDGSADLLRGRDDVHLWSTVASYRSGCAGYAWVAAVLATMDRPGWWLFLDADELFTYPLPLPGLCTALDDEGAGALEAILVDCYAATSIGPGSWFDRDWLVGARQRVFPVDGGYLLSKVPLVRWHPDVVIESGAHAASGVEKSTRRAALLHLKLLGDVAKRSRSEIERGDVIVAEHQRAYVDRLAAEPHLDLYDPAVSVRYEGTQQLVDLGLIV